MLGSADRDLTSDAEQSFDTLQPSTMVQTGETLFSILVSFASNFC